MKLTLNQARALYVTAGGHNDHSKEEWKDIHAEMQTLVDAKSDRAAGRTIDWWGCWWNCWTPRYTATAFARRVRAAAKKLPVTTT